MNQIVTDTCCIHENHACKLVDDIYQESLRCKSSFAGIFNFSHVRMIDMGTDWSFVYLPLREQMYSSKYVSYDIVETLLFSYFLVVFYANSNIDFLFLTVFFYTACPTKLNISNFFRTVFD